jgi:hypothetical protein
MKFFTILWVCSSISYICFCQSVNKPPDSPPQYHQQQLNNRVSNIDTVCNFDPIAVGNRWIYKGAINRI